MKPELPRDRQRSFVYSARPARVIFGSGTLSRLGDEIAAASIRRPLFLSTPQQQGLAASTIEALADKDSAHLFAGAVMHTPIEVTEQALALVTEHRIDGIVAIGGGSTTGLSKAIALRSDLPQIVVPTTYAGSEMTSILGETRNGAKTTQSDPRILPEIVIYDVDLTLTMPKALTAASGMNAIAHAVEALYARERNPIVSLLAEEAIGALASALPSIVSHPDAGEHDARADALYGAWLCGLCLGSVGMALHHKICHVLGGMFNLPHAETHAVMLPHALAYNAPVVPEAAAAVARKLGVQDAAQGLFLLAQQLQLPQSLREIGMPDGALEQATDAVLQAPYWNPRPIERAPIRELIAHAFDGVAPLTHYTAL